MDPVLCRWGMGCMRRLTKIGNCDWVLLKPPQLLVGQLALYDLSGLAESQTNRYAPLDMLAFSYAFPGLWSRGVEICTTARGSNLEQWLFCQW